MGDLRFDMRYAVRGLLRRPAFADGARAGGVDPARAPGLGGAGVLVVDEERGSAFLDGMGMTQLVEGTRAGFGSRSRSVART